MILTAATRVASPGFQSSAKDAASLFPPDGLRLCCFAGLAEEFDVKTRDLCVHFDRLSQYQCLEQSVICGPD